MALQTLWFALWGFLWAAYFVLDGFDFGVGMLRVFVTRDEEGRRITHTAIGPVWDGNEVWLITAGGATFAAFPGTYASMFSFLYLPMLLILFSLIVRGVSIEFRMKLDGKRWRSFWDGALAVTSFTAPLVLGLGFGNIFQGLAVDEGGYRGTFWSLFNPYGLLTAAVFVTVFLHHGALWLRYRTEGELPERLTGVARVLWVLVAFLVAAFLVSTAFATRLYDNYRAGLAWIAVPVLAAAAHVAVWILRARPLAAFVSSCAAIVLLFATALVGLYPNLIPSRLSPEASLTIFNTSSSQYTLRLMAIVALVFVPMVVVYQLLVYRFFRARLREGEAGSAAGY